MTFVGPWSAELASFAVLGAGGGAYIASALARRDTGGARLWALACVFAIAASALSLTRTTMPEATVLAVAMQAIGNVLAVVAAGFLLLGIRSFVGRTVDGPAFVIGAAALLPGAVAILDGTGRPGLASSIWVSAIVAVIAAVAAVDLLIARGRAGRMRVLMLAVLLLAAALLFARAAILLATGIPVAVQESVELVLGVVTAGCWALLMICLFVLRLEFTRTGRDAHVGVWFEILDRDSFAGATREILRRAARRVELVSVMTVRVAEVDGIRTSFGPEVAERLQHQLRVAAREFSPAVAIVGEGDGPGLVSVVSVASSRSDARRQAGMLYRGVIQAFMSDRGIVMPGVGVGVALTETLGYAFDALVAGSTEASALAQESDESSVVFATRRASEGRA